MCNTKQNFDIPIGLDDGKAADRKISYHVETDSFGHYFTTISTKLVVVKKKHINLTRNNTSIQSI